MWILGTIGAIFFVIGVVVGIRRRAKLPRARGEATVIALREDDSGAFLPVLTFVPPGAVPIDSEGESAGVLPARRPLQIEGTVKSNPPRYRVGDRVFVIFDPSNPYGAIIDSFLDKYVATVVLWIVAAMFCIFAGIAAIT